MSSETSLLNNSASPVLGYDLEVALNKLKKELDLTDIEGLIKKLDGRVEIDEENMKSMSTNIEQLLERVSALESSVDGLPSRVANIEVNINILSESLNVLDDRVKALEGGS